MEDRTPAEIRIDSITRGWKPLPRIRRDSGNSDEAGLSAYPKIPTSIQKLLGAGEKVPGETGTFGYWTLTAEGELVNDYAIWLEARKSAWRSAKRRLRESLEYEKVLREGYVEGLLAWHAANPEAKLNGYEDHGRKPWTAEDLRWIQDNPLVEVQRKRFEFMDRVAAEAAGIPWSDGKRCGRCGVLFVDHEDRSVALGRVPRPCPGPGPGRSSPGRNLP